MEQYISRAQILIEQQRYQEAVKILLEALAEFPQAIFPRLLLAESYISLDQYDLATDIIQQGIELAPDEGDFFYLKARVHLNQRQWHDAESALKTAIELDPSDANYPAYLAHLFMLRKRFKEALAVSNRALELDPENLLALNVRSSALQKLESPEEAEETIQGAFQQDPNNAYTHANYGWNLLEKGKYKEANNHFKEALRVDPTFEYAQMGLLESIKSTNIVYRLYLKYVFWMSNQGAKAQWGVIIGFYILTRILRSASRSNPELEPLLMPVYFIMVAVALLSWIIGPLGNIFLLLNPYGRMLLDKGEKLSATAVTVSLAIGTLALLPYLSFGQLGWLYLSIFGLTMTLPLSRIMQESKPAHLFKFIAGGMLLVGFLAILESFGFIGDQRTELNQYAGIYLVGFIAFQWIANYISIREDNE